MVASSSVRQFSFLSQSLRFDLQSSTLLFRFQSFSLLDLFRRSRFLLSAILLLFGATLLLFRLISLLFRTPLNLLRVGRMEFVFSLLLSASRRRFNSIS